MCALVTGVQTCALPILPGQDQSRLAVRRREAAVGEGRAAPAERLHGVIGVVADGRMGAPVEQPLSVIPIGGQAGMFAPDVGGPIIGEGAAPSQADGTGKGSGGKEGVVKGRSRW